MFTFSLFRCRVNCYDSDYGFSFLEASRIGLRERALFSVYWRLGDSFEMDLFWFHAIRVIQDSQVVLITDSEEDK